MRLLVVGFLLLLATPSVALAQQENPNRTDWDQWARAFSAYADYPSDSNADAVRTLLPPAHAALVGAPPPFDSLVDWLAMLERQVEARDSASVRLAFALERSMGGGDVGETLEIMLGKLIRIDPQLFLLELRAEEQQTSAHVPLDWIGGNLGEEYADRMNASCREYHLRVLSLQRVHDSALAAVKVRVIAHQNAAAQHVCSM